MMYLFRIFLIACLLINSISVSAMAYTTIHGEPKKKTIRLFIPSNSGRTYLRGHHWVSLTFDQKLAMVETARRGALQLGAVMTEPAERYVNEIDRMLAETPHIRQMEVGQTIQGIAIAMEDWDKGESEQ